MKTEYVNTLDGQIIKYDKWYVDSKKFATVSECAEIDKWCRTTFGSYRHDNEVDEGWWLQSSEEYAVFVLTWV